MTKQLKTIEILNPSKSATCSMWRYPESAKIFQYRGMDFDGFRVVRVKQLTEYDRKWYFYLNISRLHTLDRVKAAVWLKYFQRQFLGRLVEGRHVEGALFSSISECKGLGRSDFGRVMRHEKAWIEEIKIRLHKMWATDRKGIIFQVKKTGRR